MNKHKRNKKNSIFFYSFKNVQDFIEDQIEIPTNFIPKDFFNSKNKRIKNEGIELLNEFLKEAIQRGYSDIDLNNDKFSEISNLNFFSFFLCI
jgi:hypothetical protein